MGPYHALPRALGTGLAARGPALVQVVAGRAHALTRGDGSRSGRRLVRRTLGALTPLGEVLFDDYDGVVGARLAGPAPALLGVRVIVKIVAVRARHRQRLVDTLGVDGPNRHDAQSNGNLLRVTQVDNQFPPDGRDVDDVAVVFGAFQIQRRQRRPNFVHGSWHRRPPVNALHGIVLRAPRVVDHVEVVARQGVEVGIKPLYLRLLLDLLPDKYPVGDGIVEVAHANGVLHVEHRYVALLAVVEAGVHRPPQQDQIVVVHDGVSAHLRQVYALERHVGAVRHPLRLVHSVVEQLRGLRFVVDEEGVYLRHFTFDEVDEVRGPVGGCLNRGGVREQREERGGVLFVPTAVMLPSVHVHQLQCLLHEVHPQPQKRALVLLRDKAVRVGHPIRVHHRHDARRGRRQDRAGDFPGLQYPLRAG
ncbi:uncharacterized protein BcabD6B2_33040 [Babesia caballi]|uniref:Uncharacterized protein n=1 Tax=Babesia caballi TaxID=5871 RepID=A0AAV4LZC5_BABCB|nr:hypothetical protein BcabD6B2_33040 [Babesia caballi]